MDDETADRPTLEFIRQVFGLTGVQEAVLEVEAKEIVNAIEAWMNQEIKS